jgi:hypothetical protein
MENQELLKSFYKREEELLVQLEAIRNAIIGYGGTPKQKITEGENLLTVGKKPDKFQFDSRESKPKKTGKIEKIIVDILVEQNRAMRSLEVYEKVIGLGYDYSQNSIPSYLSLLVKDDMIQRVQNGIYAHKDFQPERQEAVQTKMDIEVEKKSNGKAKSQREFYGYIIEILKELKHPARAAEVRKVLEELGFNYAYNTVPPTLSTMANQGLIQRVEDGLYTFNEYKEPEPAKQEIKTINDVLGYFKFRGEVRRKELVKHFVPYYLTIGQLDTKLKKLVDEGKVKRKEHGIYKYVKG